MFASASNASANVAGVPAAARAVREGAAAGLTQCWVHAGADWRPTARDRSEIARLAGTMKVEFATIPELSSDFFRGTALLLAGERIIGTGLLQEWLAAPPEPDAAEAECQDDRPIVHGVEVRDIAQAVNRLAGLGRVEELAAASHRILAGTAKPSDGIVSRTINRPISQAISGLMLRWPAVRPLHATVATALTAMIMLACLLTGRDEGLILGALLFQAASILDGVDGEIARATFRTSHFGAMADSLVDAATNVGFIGGVVINLWIQGHRGIALFGAAGLAMMAFGLLLIGGRARKRDRQFTFNGVKEHFEARQSPLMQWLTWLTMRDFYALAAVLFVVLGFTAAGLVAFGVVAAGWLLVVLWVQSGKPGGAT